MILVKHLTPGFRGTCLIVGILNITFFLLTISGGIMNTMAGFDVPKVLLSSPHYSDAMFWVFLHMAVIGALIILIGLGTEDFKKQRLFSVFLVVIFSFYLFLDVTSSDNPLGSALYKGPRSVFPVIVDCFYILLYLRIAFKRRDN